MAHQLMTDEEIIELARTGKTTKRHQGAPQDIGLAIDKDIFFPLIIFIVQTRPATVWPESKSESVSGEGGSLADQVSSYLNTT